MTAGWDGIEGPRKMNNHPPKRTERKLTAVAWPWGRCRLAGWFGIVMVAALEGRLPAAAQELAPFHVGFSAASFSEVNENDAKAAVKVWAQELAKQGKIPADPQPYILRSTDEIAEALNQKRIDAVSLSTEQYHALQGRVAINQIVVSVTDRSIFDEYLLLVHHQSGIERLADLRGRSLVVATGPRAALASAWLATLLQKEGLGEVTNYFGVVTSSPKIAKVVLPVFFRQADACIVTRKGFETMVELNPQLGAQLKPVAESPEVVPFVFCFRTDYTSPIRKQILDAIANWHSTPAGRQILTIFQCDNLEERPLSCLDSTLEMLDSQRSPAPATNSMALHP
jgi:phosphonate transport system substrate-binding protein